MALRSAGDDYLEHWIAWSRKSDKFKEGECERKWATFRADGRGLTARSLLHWAEQQSGWRPPSRHEPIDDTGNARVLARMGDGVVKHTDRWGWLHWDGARWTPEGADKRVQEMQKAVLQHRLDRAVSSLAKLIRDCQEDEGYERRYRAKVGAIRSIRKHREEKHYRGARKLAESEPLLSVDYREFDQRQYLFNFANATVDLRTGEHWDHSPEDKLTQLCPHPLMHRAECKLWLKFMEDILPDPEVRKFLRLFLGYCMTADTSAQVMPVFWGTGANGKSTLVETVMHVLGDDYAMKARRDLLMVSRNAQHPTSVARMRGKRFVACVESAEGGRLDESLVKELTGGDTLAARFMRQDEFQFEPTHKVVLVTNHKPEVHGTDDAIWRRLPLVEFSVQFSDSDPRRDPELKEKLKLEARGILAWMMDGCTEWLMRGRRLDLPQAVRHATAEYRSEQDRIGQFLEEHLESDPEGRVRTEDLMRVYLQWCGTNNYRPLDGRAFGRLITEKGYRLDSTRKYRVGVRLRN
jgi:putative DNA primase/helicase